jgi:hypothetical protein
MPTVFTYAPERGLTFSEDAGVRVVLGAGPGIASRMRTAERLLDTLRSRGLTPRFVDVRFLEAPYYSLTNEW